MSVCQTCGALGGLHKSWCENPLQNSLGKPARPKPSRPEPSMHFMRGPIANVLPELFKSIPADADVTITDTKDGPGRRSLNITASWEEPRDT